MKRTVAHQDKSGVVRHLRPFVEIKRNGVRLLDSGEQRRDVWRHYRESAKGPIDVEPYLFPTRDAGEFRKLVDGARIDGSRHSDQEKRGKARVTIGCDRSVERVEVDLMMVVRRNSAKRLNAQTGQVHGLRNASVSGGGCVGDQVLMSRR